MQLVGFDWLQRLQNCRLIWLRLWATFPDRPDCLSAATPTFVFALSSQEFRQTIIPFWELLRSVF